jgi:hypothetical protein
VSAWVEGEKRYGVRSQSSRAQEGGGVSGHLALSGGYKSQAQATTHDNTTHLELLLQRQVAQIGAGRAGPLGGRLGPGYHQEAVLHVGGD